MSSLWTPEERAALRRINPWTWIAVGVLILAGMSLYGLGLSEFARYPVALAVLALLVGTLKGLMAVNLGRAL